MMEDEKHKGFRNSERLAYLKKFEMSEIIEPGQEFKAEVIKKQGNKI